MGTWELRRRVPRTGGNFPGAFAASPSDAAAALQTSPAEIRLYSLNSFDELCTLDVPEDQHVRSMVFAPGGSHLVAVSGEPGRVHLWDLALIRRQLARRRLDW